MNNNIKSQHNYKQCVVAFIDILGFKTHIKSENMNENILHFLYQIRGKNSSFKYDLRSEGEWVTGKIDLNITSFSDHIIISIPILPEKYPGQSEKSLLFSLFIEINQFISWIYYMGLRRGIILRGAIAIGEMYIDLDNNLVFGGPLVEAIENEIKLAIYPRIIIAKSLLDYIHSLKKTKQSKYYNDRFVEPSIQRDFDGMFYFHYLHLPFCLNDSKELIIIKTTIETNIKNNKENLGALSKWRWLAIYFNNTLKHWQHKENKHHDIQHITLVIDMY